MYPVRWYLAAAALVFGAITACASEHRDWAPLGSSHVDGPSDHDKIELGSSKGPFQSLKLEVLGAPVKFDHVVVHFEHGRSEVVPAGFVVRANASSREIHLRQAPQNISSVELWYERKKSGDTPRVILLGRALPANARGDHGKDTPCPFPKFCSLYRDLLLRFPAGHADQQLPIILTSLFQGLIAAGVGPSLPWRELLLLLDELAYQVLRRQQGESAGGEAVAPARALFQLVLRDGQRALAINVNLEIPVAGVGPLLDFLHNARGNGSQ